MEEVTFKDAQVQAFLAAVRFEKRDAREVQYVEAYAQRALVVEGASLTFLNGSLTTSGATKIRVVEVDGRGRFPILATPTVVVLEADAGEVYLRGYLLGALPPEQFLSFIKNATSPTPLQPAASSPATALAIAAALGAASAASPCAKKPSKKTQNTTSPTAHKECHTTTDMNSAWAVGNLTGPTLGGALADAWSDAVPYLLAAGLCLATLVASTRVRRWTQTLR